MIQLFHSDNLASAASLAAQANLPAFSPELCQTQGSDAHLVAMQNNIVMARCSLWWTHAPQLPGKRTGVLGHFMACEPAGASEVLAAACAKLKEVGCDVAVGPMDGNTWRRYRLLTDRGSEPPFFLEPDNPHAWPGYFMDAGFTPLANYFSALNADLSVEDDRIPRTRERLERDGFVVRPLDLTHFVEDLRRIYAVSRVSFQSNFLYTPIPESEFLAQYEPVRARLRPELVLLAEQEGQPVGYVFAIPDLAQAARGQAVDTVIVKTVAVLPGRRCAGLGNVLVAMCQQQARALGFRRAIHALMHESNNSLHLSGHYAKPFRRYTLYSRSL